MRVKLQTAAVLVVFGLFSGLAIAQHCENSVPIVAAPGDEIWLISARDLDDCYPPCVDQLSCQLYCDGHWNESSIQDLKSFGSDKQNIVFVHGYQTDLCSAKKRGLQVYNNLFGKCRCVGPVRYIIWAWKSERECRRPVVDFDLKSRRAVGMGDAFALTINELVDAPTTIVGYSLGAQVVVSAFTRSNLYTGNPVQVAFVAAANECSFARGCNPLSSCGHIDRALVFYNEDDIAIRTANLICRLKHGPNFQRFEEFASRNECALGSVCVVDISDLSSRKHSVVRYTSIPTVQAHIQNMLIQR